jgi:hypothetical protein
MQEPYEFERAQSQRQSGACDRCLPDRGARRRHCRHRSVRPRALAPARPSAACEGVHRTRHRRPRRGHPRDAPPSWVVCDGCDASGFIEWPTPRRGPLLGGATRTGEDPMSYAEARYPGDGGEVSASFRAAGDPCRADADPGERDPLPGDQCIDRWRARACTNVDMRPRAPGPTTHFHRSISESFYVLSGEVRCTTARTGSPPDPVTSCSCPSAASMPSRWRFPDTREPTRTRRRPNAPHSRTRAPCSRTAAGCHRPRSGFVHDDDSRSMSRHPSSWGAATPPRRQRPDPSASSRTSCSPDTERPLTCAPRVRHSSSTTIS